MNRNGQRLVVFFAALSWLGWFTSLSSYVATPHVTYLRWLKPISTSYMEEDLNDNIKYDWASIDKISIYLKQAVVLAEDDGFFSHQGLDIDAMKKAAKIDLRKKRFAKGGSTITMQLARNLYLSSDKSILRKLREILIAFKLERELPKERILELYLNVAEWGNGIYGAEAAARHYFGKDASALGKHEAAFLAAILPRPRFYDKHRGGPFLNRRVASLESRL